MIYGYSLYRNFKSMRQHLKDEGKFKNPEICDYSETLMRNSLSSYIYKNERLATFLDRFINKWMVLLTYGGQYIRNFFNFAVDKYEDQIK